MLLSEGKGEHLLCFVECQKNAVAGHLGMKHINRVHIAPRRGGMVSGLGVG